MVFVVLVGVFCREVLAIIGIPFFFVAWFLQSLESQRHCYRTMMKGCFIKVSCNLA
jgi:hypothetical protein